MFDGRRANQTKENLDHYNSSADVYRQVCRVLCELGEDKMEMKEVYIRTTAAGTVDSLSDKESSWSTTKEGGDISIVPLNEDSYKIIKEDRQGLKLEKLYNLIWIEPEATEASGGNGGNYLGAVD